MRRSVGAKLLVLWPARCGGTAPTKVDRHSSAYAHRHTRRVELRGLRPPATPRQGAAGLLVGVVLHRQGNWLAAGIELRREKPGDTVERALCDARTLTNLPNHLVRRLAVVLEQQRSHKPQGLCVLHRPEPFLRPEEAHVRHCHFLYLSSIPFFSFFTFTDCLGHEDNETHTNTFPEPSVSPTSLRNCKETLFVPTFDAVRATSKHPSHLVYKL